MTVLLDTSVLVAVFYGDHEHHDPSISLFVGLNKESGCTAAHSLAEVYAVLTGMPGKNRVSPDEALLFLADVRERLSLVSLSAAEYVDALSKGAEHRIAGGGVFDALLSRCAQKANASALYTWNVKHFARHGPAVAAIVRRP